MCVCVCAREIKRNISSLRYHYRPWVFEWILQGRWVRSGIGRYIRCALSLRGPPTKCHWRLERTKNPPQTSHHEWKSASADTDTHTNNHSPINHVNTHHSANNKHNKQNSQHKHCCVACMCKQNACACGRMNRSLHTNTYHASGICEWHNPSKIDAASGNTRALAALNLRNKCYQTATHTKTKHTHTNHPLLRGTCTSQRAHTHTCNGHDKSVKHTFFNPMKFSSVGKLGGNFFKNDWFTPMILFMWIFFPTSIPSHSIDFRFVFRSHPKKTKHHLRTISSESPTKCILFTCSCFWWAPYMSVPTSASWVLCRGGPSTLPRPATIHGNDGTIVFAYMCSCVSK